MSKTQTAMSWPRFSIVTPSFRQARFLAETMDSVLTQEYPGEVEYIVVDGGSQDGSVEVIRQRASRLAYWVSEPDRGQAHAINKGFRYATGAIHAYLNSDDVLEPGALTAAASLLSQHPDTGLVAGRVRFIDADSKPVRGWPEQFEIDRLSDKSMLEACHIAQPSTFWRGDITRELGGFTEQLRYGFDYDFWVRAWLAGHRFKLTSQVLSRFRLHDESKTLSAYPAFVREGLLLYERLLANRRLNPRQRFLLERGRGVTLGALFAHLDISVSTQAAQREIRHYVAHNPSVLQAPTAWAPFLLALTPIPVRAAWQRARRRHKG